jgi:hypothetical protein
MPRYAITERAGPFVAGFRNSGVGTVLELSERQAAHELRLGTLIDLSVPPAVTVPLQQDTGSPVLDPPDREEVTAPDQARKPKRSPA